MKNLNKFFCLLAVSVAAISCGNAPVQETSKIRMLVGTVTEGRASQGVYLFDFNQEDASYSLLDTAAAGNPTFVIPSADREHAYSVIEYNDGRQGVASYDLSEDCINPLNFQTVNGTASGADPCNIIILGRNVITSNYSGGTMSVFPLNEDGSIGPLQWQFVPEAGGPVPHLHCAVLSPEGDYLFVTDLGRDVIYRFRTSAAGLQEQTPEIAFSFSDPETHYGPRHMTFSADGRFAYLLNELGDYITVFAYENGELEHVMSEKAYQGGGAGSADIHLTPDGQYIYTSHRLKEDGVSFFKVNPSDGRVVNVGYQLTGIHPRNFAVTPNGKYLLCACRDSDRIEIYAIDYEDGSLKDTGKSILLPGPACVQFFE